MIPSMPRRGELFTVAAFAVTLRVAVFAGALFFGSLTVAAYTAKGGHHQLPRDGVGHDRRKVVPKFAGVRPPGVSRVSAMIAAVHRLGVPLPWAALGITWVSAGVAAAVAGKVFEDARIAWAMTCFIPHYLINSSLGMSEAPLLAALCLALLASQKDWPLVAGAIFGFAGLIRPVACFAVVGLLFTLTRERRYRASAAVGVAAAAVFALGFAAMQFWTGDALAGVRVYADHPGAYGGHMLVWPFTALLTTPGHDGASIGRCVYIGLHVVVALYAVLMATYRGFRPGRINPRDAVSFPWLSGVVAFDLCTGPPWGFRHFPRFTIPGAPALFWTLRKWLPRNPLVWLAIAAATAVAAGFGVVHSP